MRIMGHTDAVLRNYAIDCYRDGKPMPNPPAITDDLVRLGLHRAGLESGKKASMGLVEAQQRLAVDFKLPPSALVAIRLAEWYNWDRIRTGELRTWPLNRSALNDTIFLS